MRPSQPLRSLRRFPEYCRWRPRTHPSCFGPPLPCWFGPSPKGMDPLCHKIISLGSVLSWSKANRSRQEVRSAVRMRLITAAHRSATTSIA